MTADIATNADGVAPGPESSHFGVQAACYDYYTAGYLQDIAFYKRWIASDLRVLEIGIGTGRLASAMSRFARCYFGVDISADMMRQLRRKCPTVGAVLSPMTDFEIAIDFDRIFFPFRALQYCRTRAEQAQSLRCAAAHLAPHGKILVDMLPLDGKFCADWNGKVFRSEFPGPGGRVWTKEDHMQIDLENKALMRTVRFYCNGIYAGANDESIIWQDAAELRQACEGVGLRTTNVWRAFTFEEYDGKGEYLLEAVHA